MLGSFGKNTSELLIQQFLDPVIGDGFLDAVQASVSVALIFSALVFMISLVYNYVSSFLGNSFRETSIFSAAELKRAILMMAFIAITPTILLLIEELFSLVTGSGSWFGVDLPPPSELFGSIFSETGIMTTAMRNRMVGIFSSTGDRYDYAAQSSEFLYKSWMMFYYSRYAVKLLITLLIKVLIVASPFATLFAILPMFRDRVFSVVSLFLTLSFTKVTFSIIEALIFSELFLNISDILENAEYTDMENYLMGSFLIVIFLLYILAFWITSKYIGGFVTQKFQKSTSLTPEKQ